MEKSNLIADAFSAILDIILRTTHDGLDPEKVDSIARLLDEDVIITESVDIFVYDYNFSDGSRYTC